MAAFAPNEGYANARTRKAALFDPLLGAHAFDRNRLLTDRSAYVSFLEVQLERVTAACLATQGFSDRIEQLQNQIYTLESRIGNHRQIPTTDVPTSVRQPVCTCQATCARLADDALAAVQAVDEKIEKSEKELQNRLSEISTRVIDLLRQVVAKQRDMQLKISGNLNFSDLPASLQPTSTQPVEVNADIETAAVTPSSTLRAPPPPTTSAKRPTLPLVVPQAAPAGSGGARVRAMSAPGAAAAQARRRRAVDELLKELDLLEREGN